MDGRKDLETWRLGGGQAEQGGGPTGRSGETQSQQAGTGQRERDMHWPLPFLVPTGTGPVLCLSSSEAEEEVPEEEEAHLRLIVPGMLQLSRYLAMHRDMRAGPGVGQDQCPRGSRCQTSLT